MTGARGKREKKKKGKGFIRLMQKGFFVGGGEEKCDSPYVRREEKGREGERPSHLTSCFGRREKVYRACLTPGGERKRQRDYYFVTVFVF